MECGPLEPELPEPEPEPSPRSSGATGSPGAVFGRLQMRFLQAAEDLSLAKAQNGELEKRIAALTENILSTNEEKEIIKAEHRAEVRRLEESALEERRQYENTLCQARQQQQRCQMDRDLATDELATLRGQVKDLQMEKVRLARQVRDLEVEVKARYRFQQAASEQMARHNTAKHKLNKEVAALTEWLRRLEAEVGAASDLNQRLSLELRHRDLRAQHLSTPATAAEPVSGQCAELEELRAMLVSKYSARGDDGSMNADAPIDNTNVTTNATLTSDKPSEDAGDILRI